MAYLERERLGYGLILLEEYTEKAEKIRENWRFPRALHAAITVHVDTSRGRVLLQ